MYLQQLTRHYFSFCSTVLSYAQILYDFLNWSFQDKPTRIHHI